MVARHFDLTRAGTQDMTKVLEAGGYTYAYEPAEGGDPRTLILLHGTGGDHTSFIGLGRLVAKGAALIALKGDVVERGNLRFFRRVGERVYDMDDLALRTHRLADAIPELISAHGRDPAAAIGLGYSSGADLLGNLICETPDRLAGAVLMHPIMPFEPPSTRALSGKPVLVTCGERDPVTGPAQVEAIAERLRTLGASVTARGADSGHEVREGELAAIRDWLAAFRTTTDAAA
ncbi:MAG: alpha/beta hydrolase [Rhodobiaceae bacterium]|nr:alpha/beta hydrolase [Rhodobiaceae bacterium]MCC0040641.1 alpha/beta hydrolase [Rhodobiaceae bacterium]